MRTLLLATLGTLMISSARAGDEVSVVVSGEPQAAAPSYRAGSELYVDAKRVGAMYGGQVYWYPVSGRVQLALRGRTMQFVVDSDKAFAGDEFFPLEAPMIVRASRAFIPVSFLRSEAFAGWSGFDSKYDAETRTLQIERRATAGPAHVFSYGGRTRVVLELAPGVSWSAEPRGVGAVELLIPGGVVEGDERVEVDDGIISSYAIKQEARQARMTIRFSSSGQRWHAAELKEPRRAVVDVYVQGAAPAAEPASDKAQAEKSAAAAPLKPRRRVIVIDAGHGGKDPGATGLRGAKEKDITLAASLELARVLRERGDFEVVLTREDDAFLPLSDRSKKANDLDADIFVSLHCNASGNRRERGFEVYSVSETASDPEAERLAATENAALELEGKNAQEETAKLILLAMTKTEMLNESAPFAALVERGLAKRVDVPDRGAKQAGFYVLRGTHAPAILVEMAFLTDAKDEAALGSRRFRRRVAEGIAAGIGDYARKKGWLD